MATIKFKNCILSFKTSTEDITNKIGDLILGRQYTTASGDPIENRTGKASFTIYDLSSVSDIQKVTITIKDGYYAYMISNGTSVVSKSAERTIEFNSASKLVITLSSAQDGSGEFVQGSSLDASEYINVKIKHTTA